MFHDKLKNNSLEFARALLCRGVLDREIWNGSQLQCAGFSGDCLHCGIDRLIPACSFVQRNVVTMVEWEFHETVEEVDDERKSRKYFRPMPKSTTMADLWAYLSDWISTYVQHEFQLMWTRQFEKVHLKRALLACQRRVLSIQADWAMNFAWTMPQATQREFFKTAQTMLFTCVCEFADDGLTGRGIYKVFTFGCMYICDDDTYCISTIYLCAHRGGRHRCMSARLEGCKDYYCVPKCCGGIDGTPLWWGLGFDSEGN